MFFFILTVLYIVLLTKTVAAFAPNGRCGPDFANAICDAVQGCCSESGFCGFSDSHCSVLLGCIANCTDGTPLARASPSPISISSTTSSASASVSSTPTSKPEPKLAQSTIVVIAVVGGVVAVALIAGIIWLIYGRKKNRDDKEFQMNLLHHNQTHEANLAREGREHDERMVKHQNSQTMMNMIAAGYLPPNGGNSVLQLGSGPSTTQVPGPGRVLGVV